MEIAAATNHEIYKRFKAFSEEKDKDWKCLVGDYKEKYGENTDVDDLTIFNRLKAVYQKGRKLRGKKFEEFMDMKFKPPETTSVYLSKKLEDSPRKKQLRNKLEETQKQNRNLKRKLCEDAVEMEKMVKELFEVSKHHRQTLSASSSAVWRIVMVS